MSGNVSPPRMGMGGNGGEGEREMTSADCEAAVRQFIELTKTDEACAHFHLQDVDWNVPVGAISGGFFTFGWKRIVFIVSLDFE